MTLEQLRIFVEAAKHQSFTLAANALGLTQSAISISIRKLEERHGVVLFDRASSGLVITAAGKALLTEATRILLDVDLTIKRLESYRNADHRRSIIACTHNAYDNWMPKILAQMSDTVKFELIQGSAEDVTSWVMRGTADIGIGEGHPGHQQFKYWEVFSDSIILCCSTGSAARLPTPFGWTELEDHAPILWETDSELEIFVSEALRAHKVHEKRLKNDQFKLQSTSAVMSALEAGRCLAFVCESAARPRIGTGALTKVGEFNISVKYWVFANRLGDSLDLANDLARMALSSQDFSTDFEVPRL